MRNINEVIERMLEIVPEDDGLTSELLYVQKKMEFAAP